VCYTVEKLKSSQSYALFLSEKLADIRLKTQTYFLEKINTLKRKRMLVPLGALAQ